MIQINSNYNPHAPIRSCPTCGKILNQLCEHHMGNYLVQYSHILDCTLVFIKQPDGWTVNGVFRLKGLVILDEAKIEKLLLLK